MPAIGSRPWMNRDATDRRVNREHIVLNAKNRSPRNDDRRHQAANSAGAAASGLNNQGGARWE